MSWGAAWDAVERMVRRTAALAVVATLLAAPGCDGAGDAPESQSVAVQAERSGLVLSTRALTGRVTLTASASVRRWRLAGVTGWLETDEARVLRRDWDTTSVRDGAYDLELETAGGLRTWRISIRNTTPLPPSALANASAGLSARSTDAIAVVAAFTRRSYRPGEVARLRLWGSYRNLRLEILHVGAGAQPIAGNRTLTGTRVLERRFHGAAPAEIGVRVPEWESGVYTARLTAAGKTGFAPFVVRPRRLGLTGVAVVQPTNTWQAYNYRCSDGDGVPDTWYWTSRCSAVDTARPYLDRGVPPHFRQYDAGFLEWLIRQHKSVDMLAQEDLEQLDGAALRRLYELIVFPGHHEYVTTAEYDGVQRFRDLGGNLAFLSANNFFYRVDRRGSAIVRIGRWRDLGRPEAALVGVQYFEWNLGRFRARQYVVRGARTASWLFRGTGLGNGDRLGWWGIEVDGTTAASPRSTVVLADMPNAFATGRAAEMTYYELRGARVFAAGAFTLAGAQSRRWTTSLLLENLWERLAPQPRRAADR